MELKSFDLIIIDNTNLQRWEAKPYVECAVRCGYRVEVREPTTEWWINKDANELFARGTHGVPLVAIQKMVERFEVGFSVDEILRSSAPNFTRNNRGGRGRGGNSGGGGFGGNRGGFNNNNSHSGSYNRGGGFNSGVSRSGYNSQGADGSGANVSGNSIHQQVTPATTPATASVTVTSVSDVTASFAAIAIPTQGAVNTSEPTEGPTSNDGKA
ncbi:NEDD4-binding protein 2 [Podochytrium sp. JEL0797]|nr:NEDD4-binding protein 2 [Podochytrium sp. JEL0797]